LIRQERLLLNADGTVDRRTSPVLNREVLVKADGHVDLRSSAVKQRTLRMKKKTIQSVKREHGMIVVETPSIFFTRIGSSFTHVYKISIQFNVASVYTSLARYDTDEVKAAFQSSHAEYSNEPAIVFSFERLFMTNEQSSFLFHLHDLSYMYISRGTVMSFESIATIRAFDTGRYPYAVDNRNTLYLFAYACMRRWSANVGEDDPYSSYNHVVDFCWEVPPHLVAKVGAAIIDMIPYGKRRAYAKRYFDLYRRQGYKLTGWYQGEYQLIQTFDQYWDAIRSYNVHAIPKQKSCVSSR
jgi:hypothetical protein